MLLVEWARKGKRLWKEPEAQAPWDCRAGRKQQRRLAVGMFYVYFAAQRSSRNFQSEPAIGQEQTFEQLWRVFPLKTGPYVISTTSERIRIGEARLVGG